MPAAIFVFAIFILFLAGLIITVRRAHATVTGGTAGAKGQAAQDKRRCFFTRHEMALHDEDSHVENWHKTYGSTGKPVPGSEFIRNRHYNIKKCIKCGLETAGSYLADDRSGTWKDVTVDYATKKMNEIRGIGQGTGTPRPPEKTPVPNKAKLQDDPCMVPLIPDKE